MAIEETAKRFRALGNKPILSKAEQAEVRRSMCQLKEEGMNNDEISKLSQGRWSASTVKGYTKGVRANAANSWQDVTSLFDKLISANMTVDDVGRALAVSQELEIHHTSFDQVIDLLGAVESSSIDMPDLIKLHQGLKQNGLSPEEVAHALVYKQQLEENGLDLDSLGLVAELAKKRGDPHEIIEAVSKYGSLAELAEQVTATKQELDSLNQQVADVQEQFEQVQARLFQSKGQIEAYEKALEMGFTEAQLLKLTTLARKHGTVKRVLEAVEGYVDYTDIASKVNKAKADLSSTEARIDKLEAAHAHLKTAITMCQTLLQQYKFGLDAMATILSVAKKYGEPVNVLKGLEAYGKLEALQQELGNLEGEVTERKKLLAELEGKYHEELDGMESLHATALKVGAEVSRLESRTEDSKEVHKILNLITNSASADYDEHWRLVCVIAASLHKWVISNEHKFRSPYSIKDGLKRLVSELGGD